jgi:hypothetical protein
MIACTYFGALLGISLVFAQIKGRFSLQEAKDLAVYGMALDFDAPSRLTRFMSKCLRPHLERTLSKAYGKRPVCPTLIGSWWACESWRDCGRSCPLKLRGHYLVGSAKT